MSVWDALDETLESFQVESQNRQRREPFGFSVPKGGKSEFVIIDDSNLFYRYEHRYSFPNNVSNRFGRLPCLASRDDTSTCPLCMYAAMNPKGGIKGRTVVSYITVMQLGEFKYTPKGDTKEKVIKNPIRALVMMPQSLDKLKLYRAEFDGNLTGLHVVATRGSEDTAVGVGDNWMPKPKKFTAEQIKERNSEVKLFDWENILPIFSENELKQRLAILTGQPVSGGVAAERRTEQSEGDAPVAW